MYGGLEAISPIFDEFFLIPMSCAKQEKDSQFSIDILESNFAEISKQTLLNVLHLDQQSNLLHLTNLWHGHHMESP